MISQPKWISSTHVERTEAFSLPVPIETVFPLLCPIREYEWIPGWSCEMVHSRSGVAEKGAVFATTIKPFGKMLWTCTCYEPPKRIEYLRTIGSDVSALLEIELSPKIAGCDVTWTMKSTIKSSFRGRIIGKQMAESNFHAMISRIEKQLQTHLIRE